MKARVSARLYAQIFVVKCVSKDMMHFQKLCHTNVTYEAGEGVGGQVTAGQEWASA